MPNNFDEIKTLKLTRTNTQRYTLGDKSLDRLWGLDQYYATLTPKSEATKELAAATLVYGFLGYTVSNFTAIPAGYIATFENGNDVQTIIISGNEKPYYMNYMIEVAQKTIDDDNVPFNDFSFAMTLRGYLEKETLMYCAYIMNYLIKRNDEFKEYDDRIKQAMFPFSSEKDSLNSQNCNNNHKVLATICCKQLGVEISEQVLIDYVIKNQPEIPEGFPQKEEILKVRKLYNLVVHEWILPGYFTYRGADRKGEVPRKSEILNDPERIEKLHDVIQGEINITAIINMCSTDYTADMVYYILEILDGSAENKGFKNTMKKVDQKLIPTSKNLEEQKAWVRKHIKNLTYSEHDAEIDF